MQAPARSSTPAGAPRRAFLRHAAALGGAVLLRPAGAFAQQGGGGGAGNLRLFLCGDVMTGRGIDQVLPHPVDPVLHEPWVRDARTYVELAEAANGPIGAPLSWGEVWGDALDVLARWDPDARIVNLETAVTAAGEPWPGKGIHYRMHPANTPLLTAAGIDVCVLANNHVLDWGYTGLEDTLAALDGAGLRAVGAGRDEAAALRPAAVPLGGGRRLLVFAAGTESAGVPRAWAADPRRAGLWLLPDPGRATAALAADRIRAVADPDDLVVFSLHWGSNWGYRVARAQRDFARALIDEAGVDVVYGHSSHHPRPLEVHAGRPILYGCGDFLNDYEGIGGHEEYRPTLVAMYFLDLDRASGALRALHLVPMRIERFRLHRAAAPDARWLAERLGEHGTALEVADEAGTLRLAIDGSA